MNTVTIVFVAVWNFVLVVAFGLVIAFRKDMMRWITGADGPRGRDVDEAWISFLSDHPELR